MNWQNLTRKRELPPEAENWSEYFVDLEDNKISEYEFYSCIFLFIILFVMAFVCFIYWLIS